MNGARIRVNGDGWMLVVMGLVSDEHDALCPRFGLPDAKPSKATCKTAWWCPKCSKGIELGEEARKDLVPTPETRAICFECGTELEGAL